MEAFGFMVGYVLTTKGTHLVDKSGGWQVPRSQLRCNIWNQRTVWSLLVRFP